jgi:hypothetical protein
MLTVLLTRGLEALEFVTGKVEKPKRQKRPTGTAPAVNTGHEPQKA